MLRLSLTLLVLISLGACNAYNPASAAAQDAYNRNLKLKVSPEGRALPQRLATGPVVVQ